MGDEKEELGSVFSGKQRVRAEVAACPSSLSLELARLSENHLFDVYFSVLSSSLWLYNSHGKFPNRSGQIDWLFTEKIRPLNLLGYK